MILVFEGVLSSRDQKQHLPLAFDVPEGVSRIIGRFTATPKRGVGQAYDNLISLSVFGPNGSRGARHNNPEMDFEIASSYATPGYLSGAIEAGRWMVFLDTFRILGPDPVSYILTVTFDTRQVATLRSFLPTSVARRGADWYRGDLHAHTLHSDGRWDVADLVAWGRHNKLDFVTLTDHNTVAGHAELLSLAGDDLLTLTGMELTTHAGHALSLGGRDWREWRTGAVTGKTMPGLANEIMMNNALFVIAHPMSPGDPACTGCRWEFSDMMPGEARIVEIWNGGPWSDYNEDGLALYRRWLAAGHRLAASAGSDTHGPRQDNSVVGFNNVYAMELSEVAILQAVSAGRNYLSSGPKLILTAEDDDSEIPMGGTAKASAKLRIAWSSGPADLILQLIGPTGKIFACDLPARAIGEVVHSDLPECFVMAELRDGRGNLHAVTNPIFLI